MSEKFKVGDLVYYPQLGHGIFTLKMSYNLLNYPVRISKGDFDELTFTADGKLYEDDKAATIFHATPENQRLLEQLHGIKLEDAPVKPTSHEIIKAMLERGDKSVDCWVSDTVKEPTSSRYDLA